MCRRALLSGVLGYLVLLASSRESLAQIPQTYNWNEALGGLYGASTNWLPNGIPNASHETAQFALNATYTVQVNNAYTVSGLVARDTGSVTLDFDPATYNTSTFLMDPTSGRAVDLTLNTGDVRVSTSTTIGRNSSSGHANLHLQQTALITGSMTVGEGTSVSGRLVIDELSSLDSTGPFVLGGSGDAELEIESGSEIVCNPVFCTTFARQGNLTTASAVVGDGPDSTATAEIYGIWSTGDLTVGNSGSGAITLFATGGPHGTPGTLNSTSASIAALPGSGGNVLVTGASANGLDPILSEWDIDHGLTLGGTSSAAGGLGRIEIGPFNEVSVGADFRSWASGTLALIENAMLSITGTARLGGTLEFIPIINPQLNSTYHVLTAGSVIGTFDATNLPPLAPGLDWSVEYMPTSVSLKVVEGLPGDFNNDGKVNAADYVAWAKGVGVASTPANYNLWRTNFGRTLAGSGSALPVPESCSLLQVLLVLTGLRMLPRYRVVAKNR
jgi:hypothetical protein